MRTTFGESGIIPTPDSQLINFIVISQTIRGLTLDRCRRTFGRDNS